MRVTFLGTGTSVGVPRIACDCPVCTSSDPRNKRLRCSVLLQQDGRSVLVDTTPDLRTQVLRVRLQRLDAVVFTHGHADHLHGLDDVRCYCFELDGPLPCYAAPQTVARIRSVFDYAFRDGNPSSVPQLRLHPIQGPFQAGGLDFVPIPLRHGEQPVLGFRVGGFAYLTDCSAIPDSSRPLLQGLNTLVLDALRDRPHPTHFSLQEAVVQARVLAPQRTFFTHMAHELDHHRTNAQLPPGMSLAYDGLTVELD